MLENLLNQYLKLSRNGGVITTANGFATFSILGEYIYLEDIYVDPIYRNSEQGNDLYNQVVSIGKENNCTYIKGAVDIGSSTEQIMSRTMKCKGFEEFEQDKFYRYFRKQITWH